MSDSVEDFIADDNLEAKKGRLGGLGIATAIVFGLFYAYALWSALARLISGEPAGLAFLGVAVPIVLFALALWLGIRRSLGEKALIYVLGLLATAALSFSLIGFEGAMAVGA
jgi:hypothetical protein